MAGPQEGEHSEMPVLKAPPKLIRNATIQVRVEEEVDLKLRKYAEFIDATPAFVVAESLKLLFNKDAEFREWLAHHAAKPGATQAEKPDPQEPAQRRPGMRTMFDDAPQRAATK
jgi:predicted transcriptional regulator